MLLRLLFVLTTLLVPFKEVAWAQQADRTAAVATPRLGPLDSAEAAILIRGLQDLQRRLSAGERFYFELLAGSLASYPMTQVSPRAAFLDLSIERATRIRRERSDGSPRFRMEIEPDGPGRLLWDVVVLVGYSGEVERVEMLYRPPHPF